MRRTGHRLTGLTALAAVVIAACGGPASPSASGAPADDVHYRWQAGDCLLVESRDAMPREPFGAGIVVDCEQQHAFEVFFTGDIEGDEDGPYPEDLADQTWEVCAAAFHDYVGAHLSETALDILVYRPDRTEWAGGLRYQACLVEDPRSGEDPPLVAGSLRDGADRAPSTVAAGQCFAGQSILGPPTPCSEPHLAEAIGRFTHPEPAGAPWPGASEVRAAANGGCEVLLGEYATAGGSVVAVSPVAFARPLGRSEWEDGLRTVACAALVFDSDHHHAEVVGSLSEADWWVIGTTQAA